MASQPPAASLASPPTVPGGLYIHVPFCRQKCPYCDFYSTTALNKIPAFCEALKTEIRLAGSDAGFDSLYFGGGTPSLLPAEKVGTIIATARSTFGLGPDIEITLEVNPGTVNKAKLDALRQAEVNRLNIGVQSFNDQSLRFLGRIHTAAQAQKVIADARRAGFDNIGIDIIYGLPEQSWQQVKNDLRQALSFEPEHLACYILTIEEGTPLFDRRKKGLFTMLSGSQTAILFAQTAQFLRQNSYLHYEISNFARKSRKNCRDLRSHHNSKYWSQAPYIGFGPAAHSFSGNTRSWNRADLEGYLVEIAAGRMPIAGSEILSAEQHLMETVYLGLRTAAGINLETFKQRFGFNFYKRHKANLDDLIKKGYVHKNQNRLKLTSSGMCIHQSIAALFV